MTNKMTNVSDYEAQLEAATRLLAARMERAAPDSPELQADIRKSVADALNNAWQEGISLETWAERAALAAHI